MILLASSCAAVGWGIESISQLSKHAVAWVLAVKGRAADVGLAPGVTMQAAGAALARVRSPHGPVASANAEREHFGHAIGHDDLGLNAAPCAA
jgi:hypothetical protein